MKNRLLVISQDIIGHRMAGPGIRMWEFARVLAAHTPVTLIATQPIDLDPYPNIEFGHYEFGKAGALRTYLAQAQTVLANGFVAHAHPELIDFQGKLVIDLYDPVILESLETFRHYPLVKREQMFLHDVENLRRMLMRGDHFLCATERQRDLYIGGLLALGRLNPALIDADPLLRTLIDVVPFGVSDVPPLVSGQPALRGVLDDLGSDHEIILWSSGLWDWLDPQTVVRAMPQVLAQVPNARLVFLAGRRPGLGHEMFTPKQTRQLAAELGLLGQGVHFYEEWIPYERRADFLLEATVMVSLHREHLEMRYAAVRSRVLDHFWVGKPTVLSAGDAAAELIAAHDAGEVVPIGDVDAVAAALIRLLVDPQRQSVQSMNAAKLGQQLRWSQVVQPLVRMLAAPLPVYHTPMQSGTCSERSAVSTDLLSQEETIPMLTSNNTQTFAILQKLRNDAIRVQEQLWRINPRLSGSLLRRWLLQKIWYPLMEPQRDYNAAVLRSIYAIAEQLDHTTRMLLEISERLDRRSQALEQSEQELSIREIGQQIRDFAVQLAGIEEATAQVLAHIGGVLAMPPQQEP